MVDKKITELTELTTPVSADVLAIVDDPAGTPVTKKITFANVEANITHTNITAGDGSDHADVASNTSASHTQNTDTALGAQSENLDMNTHKIVGVVDPTVEQDAATKGYVDDLIRSRIELFLTENASDIGSYFDLETDVVIAAKEDITQAITAYSTTLIASFASILDEPEIDAITLLESGIYSAHLHASTNFVTGMTFYFEFYHRTSGGTETLLGTSHDSSVLTTSEIGYSLHAIIASDTAFVSGDRIVVKIYGRNGGGAVKNVTIYMEGDTATRVEFPGFIEPGALNLWTRAGTVLSPKTAGDDIKVSGVTIFDAAPILVFQDSNGAGAASTGFIEWKDQGGGRAGYFGNASSGDDDLSWANEQGGHIKIITTGAGELQVSAPLNMNTHKIINVVDPVNNQEAATKKYVDDEDAAADAHITADGSSHANVVTNTSGVSTNVTAIGLNTTHRGSAGGTDHSDVNTNNAKVSNVSTNLSEGTSTNTTVDVNSSDGTNATLASASTTRAGVLTKAKWDEVVANTAAKHAQSHTIVSHDTTATGAELTTVADGVAAKNAHTHTHVSTTGRTANDHHAQSHNIASHSDTTGTGAELNTLTDGSDTAIHTHTTLQPTGAITMYGAAAAPTGWVLCNGASLLRSGTYAALFAVIGVTYGSADGTHFNVPDMRGIFPRGAGVNTTLSDANGTGFTGVLGTYQNDKMQGHEHAMKVTSSIGNGASSATGFPAERDNATNTLWRTAGNQNNLICVIGAIADGTNGTPRLGNETNPANLGLTFIIKT